MENDKVEDVILTTKMKRTVLVIVWFTFFIFAANLCFILECCFSTINYTRITNNIFFFILPFVPYIERRYINTKLLVILFIATVLVAVIIYVPLTVLKNSYSWVFLIALIVINAIFLFKYLFIKEKIRNEEKSHN